MWWLAHIYLPIYITFWTKNISQIIVSLIYLGIYIMAVEQGGYERSDKV